MADLTDSVNTSTSPASSRHLTGDGVLAALQLISDSLDKHSTSINDLKGASGTGKILFN